jgi:hypothetical protein
MSEQTQQQLRAVTVAVAPVVLLAGFLSHPYVADPMDPSEIAAAAAADPGRWGLAHIVLAVGLAFSLLMFFAVRTHLRGIGENRWSFVSVPLAAVGLTMFAFIVGVDGLGGRAAAEIGAEAAYFEEAYDLTLPVQLAAGIFTALALLALALAVASSGLLAGAMRVIVVVAFLVVAASLFVPMGWAAYVGSPAFVVGAWPVAYAMWPREASVG